MKMDIELRLIKAATFASQAQFETVQEIRVGGHNIPAGTKTDGATQPRWMVFVGLLLLLTSWLPLGMLVISIAYLFPPFGNYTLAAIVHDYLLDNRGELTRHQIDIEMKKVLDELGVSGIWRVMMYRLVRINSKFLSWEIG